MNAMQDMLDRAGTGRRIAASPLSLMEKKLGLVEEFLGATEALAAALEEDAPRQVQELLSGRQSLMRKIDRVSQALREEGWEDRRRWEGLPEPVRVRGKFLTARIAETIRRIADLDRSCERAILTARDRLAQELSALNGQQTGLRRYGGRREGGNKFLNVRT